MTIALSVLPDFLLIALGALLKRMPGFEAAFWTGLERLVYYVLFPALLFRALATAPLAIADAGPLVAISVAFTVAGMLLAAAGRPLLKLPADVFAACFQCAFRFNTYLALALISRVAGERGVALLSLVIGVLVPLVNIAAVAMLAGGKPAHVANQLVRNPLVLGCVAGIAWNLSGVAVPSLPLRVIELLAAAALPLGLLAVGAGLSFALSTLPAAALAWFHTIKLIALPALALLLARTASLDAVETRVALVMAAVPTATSAYVLAVQMRAPGAPVALLISTGTLLAAATLPLWIAFAGH